jgi:phage/plasmid primase-like uncharacterized protein
MILAEAMTKARDADIVATAERLGVRLSRGKANERNGRCPACGGEDKFRIDVKKKAWRCSRCNKGVVAVDLVMRARGCGFREAVSFLVAEAT